MKRILFSLTVASVAMFTQVSSVRAGDQDFTVHNKTGVEIHELYVSPHSSNDWEEDVLGKDKLPDGEDLDITFSPKEKADEWDLKVVDSKGNSITWENLKLTEITDVTLYYKDGEATAVTQNGSN
ncbi:hypothetical protein TSACC_3566 [Terrimicrobium sacchariphilum]|uniref:Argininosuccinate lyase n=1 Tax=Terrimicrobium sacchariphilum TaxID=690879 RepID=A0A146GD55_TERSA|nr:hypothetical protein [Terrimicrobium sacchariphilum]GAT35499.1 hypothetical protein TSACC_3566 [Terrimicrobium sacchariphilum]